MWIPRTLSPASRLAGRLRTPPDRLEPQSGGARPVGPWLDFLGGGPARRRRQGGAPPVTATTEHGRQHHGRRHDAPAARERCPLRASDATLEPKDEALH